MPSREVMSKFAKGKLHSGSKTGPKVKSRGQAIAIKMSEERKEKVHGGHYPDKGKHDGEFKKCSKCGNRHP